MEELWRSKIKMAQRFIFNVCSTVNEYTILRKLQDVEKNENKKFNSSRPISFTDFLIRLLISTRRSPYKYITRYITEQRGYIMIRFVYYI